MKIAVLASGSKGNVTYIETPNTKLLIDFGLSYKEIKNRLLKIGIMNVFFDGVLITHEHIDHTFGFRNLDRSFNFPIYFNENTYLGLHYTCKESLKDQDIRYFDKLESFRINDILITPIPLYHDSKECNGFILTLDNQKIVYITDTGYIHRKLYPLLENADLYMIEANHDPSLLMESLRPLVLKLRILGDKGHLSNQDAISSFCMLKGQKTKKIILAHRSQECNSLEAINQCIDDVFSDYELSRNDFEIIFANQDEPTKLIEV